MDQLRLLLKEYHLSSEDEKKAVRHHMYQKHGGIGKLVVKSCFDEVKKLEDQYLGTANKSIAELNQSQASA